jgi:signal peptidase I
MSSPIFQNPTYAASIPNAQGKAILAVSGAMVWPGLGHFLVGSAYLGLMWFSLAIGLMLGALAILANPQFLPWLGILVPLVLIVGIVQLLDAVRCSRHDNPGLLPDHTARFAAAIVLMITAFLWHHRVVRYLQNHVLEVCYTPTPSMAPLLQAGDYFVTLKGMPINRWDIAGFNAPDAFAGRTSENWMKRVVGLPGETVEVTPAAVLINGKPLTIPAEAGPYLCIDHWGQTMAKPSKRNAANGCRGNPITLGPDEYYLLGDNTTESLDARLWPSIHGRHPGALPLDEITCKVVGICWPPSRWRLFQ